VRKHEDKECAVALNLSGKSCRGSAAPLVLAGAVVLMLGGILGGLVYFNSDGYIAGQNLGKAAELGATGSEAGALELYALVADGATDHVPAAKSAMSALVRAMLTTGDGEAAINALKFSRMRRPSDGYPITDLIDVALQSANTRQSTDVDASLAILERVGRMASARRDEVRTLREATLRLAVANTPGNAQYAISLALMMNEAGKTDEAVNLLAPHREKLGATEAARILGQADMARGAHDLAYPLLSAYVDERLDAMRKLEKGYEQRYDELWDRQIAGLNKDEGSASFYEAWNKADEDARGVLVDEYVRAQLADNGELEVLRVRWRDASAVVPIALDVGALMLYRAMGVADAEQRQVELERAEATFLSVQGVAGESDRYRKDLGQVYYWLGKQEEGEQLFTALITDQARASQTLLEISEIYRELGLSEKSFTLSKEAYKNAKSDEDRYWAARQNSLLARGDEEQIKWLERADPDNTAVQASLNEALALKAQREEDIPAAIEYLKKAIAIYGSQKRDGTSSNNYALAAFSLYRLEADAKLLADARARMIEAAELSPSNAIVLSNAAENLLEFGMQELQENALSLSTLGWEAEYAYFDALWDSPAERAAVFAEMDSITGITALNAILPKALVLRPKDTSLYDIARDYYTARRDLTALRRVHQLLAASRKIDPRDAVQSGKFYRGEGDTSYILQAKESYDYWHTSYKKRLQSLTGQQMSLVLYEYANATSRAARFGVPIEPSGLLEAAEIAHVGHQSNRSRYNLRYALLLVAFDSLKDRADWQERRAGCLNCLQPEGWMHLLAGEKSPLGDVVREHPAVIEAARLAAEDVTSQRLSNTPLVWSLLSQLEPYAANAAAEDLRTSELPWVRADLRVIRYPHSVSGHLARAVLSRLRGDSQPVADLPSLYSALGVSAPVALAQ
jgi:hypothetical protein